MTVKRDILFMVLDELTEFEDVVRLHQIKGSLTPEDNLRISVEYIERKNRLETLINELGGHERRKRLRAAYRNKQS